MQKYKPSPLTPAVRQFDAGASISSIRQLRLWKFQHNTMKVPLCSGNSLSRTISYFKKTIFRQWAIQVAVCAATKLFELLKKEKDLYFKLLCVFLFDVPGEVQ